MAKPMPSTVTVANGQTVSPMFQLGPYTLIGLIVPSTFDGAAITFQVSMDDSTYVPLCDPATGTARSITAAASKAFDIDPKWFLAWQYAKLVCGTVQATTNTDFTIVKARIE